MRIVFTNGIYGQIKDGMIEIISGGNKIQTGQPYNFTGLKSVEEKYNIKLVCEVINEDNVIRTDSDYNFMVVGKEEVRDITGELYSLDALIVGLYDLITEEVFPDIEEYYALLPNSPIFISSEGWRQSFFMSIEEFKKSLVESTLFNELSEVNKRKFIYLTDIHSLLDDVKHSFYSIEHSFINSCNEFTYSLEYVSKRFNQEISVQPFESMFMGHHATVMSSNFMTSVIRICSTLDLVTKLTHEILNIPAEFNKYIKFNSGNLYFSNIGRFEEALSDFNLYPKSLISNRGDYEGLVFLRNTIMHNSFISTQPSITYGYKTHEVNHQDLLYSIMYLWDIDENGKATRWLNRSKFYSQNRCIQKYIYEEILKFYKDFRGTMELFNELLSR